MLAVAHAQTPRELQLALHTPPLRHFEQLYALPAFPPGKVPIQLRMPPQGLFLTTLLELLSTQLQALVQATPRVLLQVALRMCWRVSSQAQLQAWHLWELYVLF